jgi:ParB family chromosome partitioning protein
MTGFQSQITRPIDAIKVGSRHRKDVGDLAALAKSIDDLGLLQPIAITPTNDLIAGQRRLLAWPFTKFAGEEIPVRIIEIEDIVRGEYAENTDRKDFTLSEAVAIKRALEPKLKAEARARQAEGGRSKASAKLAEAGETRDKVAAFTGVKRTTLAKAEELVAAAEAEPDKYGKLVDQMDRTGKVSGPFRRCRNMKAAESIKAEPPPLPMQGPYEAGIIDIPWSSEPTYEGHGVGGSSPYPTMTPEQAAALPIPSILAADASVFMWITNSHLIQGHHLTIAKAWGLKPAALLTWVKRKWGQGRGARGATEHLIQMVRGNARGAFCANKTWFEGEEGAHSQKPQEAYEIVERLSPALRYFEITFLCGKSRRKRKTREKWDFHVNEIGALAEPVVGESDSAAQARVIYQAVCLDVPNSAASASQLPVSAEHLAYPTEHDPGQIPPVKAGPNEACSPPVPELPAHNPDAGVNANGVAFNVERTA